MADSLHSTPVLLVDRAELIIGVLVGFPADTDDREVWAETLSEALKAMDECREDMRFGNSRVLPKLPGSDGENLRGPYLCANEGPSYGGGQPVNVVCILILRWYV